MGDYYELKSLGGAYYVEYSSESSGWKVSAEPLTPEQLKLYDVYNRSEIDRRSQFLKSLINERDEGLDLTGPEALNEALDRLKYYFGVVSGYDFSRCDPQTKQVLTLLSQVDASSISYRDRSL